MTNAELVVVVAALLGAIVASLLTGALTFVGQALLDRARERARGREAAAMLRAELIRGQAAIVLVLKGLEDQTLFRRFFDRDHLRGASLFTPSGRYIDTLGAGIVSRMPLRRFTAVMAVYARWDAVMRIARHAEEHGRLAQSDHRFLEKWAQDVDVAQEILFLASQRWWSRRRLTREEREVERRLTADQVESERGFEATGTRSYYSFVPKK